MKKIFVLFIIYILCSCVQNRTVDDIVQNLTVESYDEKLFNNGREVFLYTLVESKGVKITIMSNVDKTDATIVSMK